MNTFLLFFSVALLIIFRKKVARILLGARGKMIVGQRVTFEQWKPKNDTAYWYINTHGAVSTAQFASYNIEDILKSFNYFATKKEAEEAAYRVKAVLKEFHEGLEY